MDNPPIHIKNSSKHGKGVFATRKILADEVITFYPIDGIEFELSNESVDIININLDSEHRQHINEPHSTTYNMYKMRINSSMGKVNIIGNPTLHDDMTQVGHLINDANPYKLPAFEYNHSVPTLSDMIDFIDELDTYIMDSKSQNNCFSDYVENTLTIRIIANKDIPAGNELLMPYGTTYWIRPEAFTAYPPKWAETILHLLNPNDVHEEFNDVHEEFMGRLNDIQLEIEENKNDKDALAKIFNTPLW
jgi:SET domain-containing protein